MNSVNIKNNSENQTFGVLQNADEQERTFLIEKKHENSFKSNNDLILSIRDKENQLIQKEDDFSTENSLNSMLPNYKSLIEKFIIDEPPKFEVVTGKFKQWKYIQQQFTTICKMRKNNKVVNFWVFTVLYVCCNCLWVHKPFDIVTGFQHRN
nr:uncharacterized protein LOC124813734 isoform X2 [Hydra vulgaris]